MKIATYDTDLTDAQWHLLRRFLPAAQKRGRPRTARREVINAILYLVKTGAQWRLLPKKPPAGPDRVPPFAPVEPQRPAGPAQPPPPRQGAPGGRQTRATHRRQPRQSDRARQRPRRESRL